MLKNYSKIKVHESGTKFYFNDEGQHHRLDGPAVEYSYGTKIWYINGNAHRNIDPCLEWSDGGKRWFFKDDCHRVGGCSLYDFWFIHSKKYTKQEYFNKVWDI